MTKAAEIFWKSSATSSQGMIFVAVTMVVGGCGRDGNDCGGDPGGGRERWMEYDITSTRGTLETAAP